MRLSLNDYISILKYYEIEPSGMKTKDIKRKAEDILAKKLCRCIKSVDKHKAVGNKQDIKQSESKAIAVCKNSVLTKKNLKIAKFKCKRSAKLLSSQKNNKLMKTKRNLLLRERKR